MDLCDSIFWSLPSIPLSWLHNYQLLNLTSHLAFCSSKTSAYKQNHRLYLKEFVLSCKPAPLCKGNALPTWATSKISTTFWQYNEKKQKIIAEFLYCYYIHKVILGSWICRTHDMVYSTLTFHNNFSLPVLIQDAAKQASLRVIARWVILKSHFVKSIYSFQIPCNPISKASETKDDIHICSVNHWTLDSDSNLSIPPTFLIHKLQAGMKIS